MNVDRGRYQNAGEAEHRLAYCLDRLEAAPGFCGDVDWKTRIAPSLTLEELIGAVVAAEIDLADAREDVEHYAGSEPLGQFFGYTCAACDSYQKRVTGVEFADGSVQIQCPECKAVETVEPLPESSRAEGEAVVR